MSDHPPTAEYTVVALDPSEKFTVEGIASHIWHLLTDDWKYWKDIGEGRFAIFTRPKPDEVLMPINEHIEELKHGRHYKD